MGINKLQKVAAAAAAAASVAGYRVTRSDRDPEQQQRDRCKEAYDALSASTPPQCVGPTGVDCQTRLAGWYSVNAGNGFYCSQRLNEDGNSRCFMFLDRKKPNDPYPVPYENKDTEVCAEWANEAVICVKLQILLKCSTATSRDWGHEWIRDWGVVIAGQQAEAPQQDQDPQAEGTGQMAKNEADETNNVGDGPKITDPLAHDVTVVTDKPPCECSSKRIAAFGFECCGR